MIPLTIAAEFFPLWFCSLPLGTTLSYQWKQLSVENTAGVPKGNNANEILKGSVASLEKEVLEMEFRRISELGILHVSYILLDFPRQLWGPYSFLICAVTWT